MPRCSSAIVSGNILKITVLTSAGPTGQAGSEAMVLTAYFTVGFQLYHVYSIGSANSTLVEIIGVTADSDIAPAPGSAISSNRSII